ncbi:MAG: biotin transporter BioY [Longimonas sp.]|uniref:biotin transporter BioY n=1 Tax=Longimonas sp. TaxID=2039626 RepID=UPI00334E6EF6
MKTAALSLHSSRTSWMDRLRSEDASVALQVAGITGFALLTAFAADANMRLYLWEVPITLQTMMVYASGLFLGARNGMLAQVLYLALGLFIPVYAGDGTGVAYLLGAASAGYLLAYPAAAFTIGALTKRWNSLTGSTLSMLIGAAIVFTAGVVWLHYVAGHATWMESIDKGFLRFALIDLVKIGVLGFLFGGMRQVMGTSDA